jgi:uncharacterized protein (UPF0332 family)
VVREKGFDEEVGRLLRSLFERRNQADYAPIDVPEEEAEFAIAAAEHFVDEVQSWLDAARE